MARHAGSRAGRRDARRMGAAGCGARAEAALAYLLVIVASSRSCASATQQNFLEVLGGEGSYEAQVVGEAAPARWRS